jgi:alkylresorcinol/alkylpyrone synthase
MSAEVALSSTDTRSGPVILSVGRALPPHYADQQSLIAAFRQGWSEQHYNLERLEELHRAVQVSGRYLALPIEEYEKLGSFAERNQVWQRAAADLGASAILSALESAGLSALDVDALVFVTVTGVSTPSIDATLVNRIGLRPDVKRMPIFGLGCVAGAAGTARASDYLMGFPEQVCVLLAVELCSLTLQRRDLSVANIIASGLFADGAAAAVIAGPGRVQEGLSLPRVLATRSVFYPDTERVMGWDLVDGGFKVVLSSKVPQLVLQNIRKDVDSFLAAHGLDRTQIAHWIVHTGGPKVLRAFESALELPSEALEGSWRSLSRTGNLSSASVLFVLGELMDAGRARKGDWGLMLAMGPGFCSELLLLRW